MLSEIRLSASAKVNLGLKVLPRREDGYHNIESIFQTTQLKDHLIIKTADSTGICSVNCQGMMLEDDNTLTKTYNTYRKLTGFDQGVHVELQKGIPAGGGLGGGSSDAASFLKGLSILSGIELTDELADKVAGEVGSDVFFFLHSGETENNSGAAVVSGRGEICKKITPRNDLYFVLVFPEVHSSTKEAYALIDESYESGRFTVCPAYEELEKIYNSPVKDWSFANSFTQVLVDKYPVIGKAISDMKRSGALWADMSGSGATVFGAFESSVAAQKAKNLLQQSWRRVW